MPQRNDGVIVQNSDFTGAGSVVIGKTVRVRIGEALAALEGRQSPELAASVAELVRVVERDGGASDSPAAVGEQTAAIAEELAKPAPERPRVLRMIDALTSMAGGVTAITGAAEAVRVLVEHLH